jgi:hypothetical protein
MGLGLIIVGEWLFANYTQHRLLTSISSENLPDYKADELPEIDLAKQPEESYVDLVARPLFVKGRRPVDEPRPEAEQAAAKSEAFDWQLTGIYGTKKTVSALFDRPKAKGAKDRIRKITVGDELDGWKLTDISKDKVIFKQGSEEKELLLRKPKLKALAPRTNGAIPAAPAPAPAPIPEPAADTTEDANEQQTPEGNQ